jgi:hypothetical protein
MRARVSWLLLLAGVPTHAAAGEPPTPSGAAGDRAAVAQAGVIGALGRDPVLDAIVANDHLSQRVLHPAPPVAPGDLVYTTASYAPTLFGAHGNPGGSGYGSGVERFGAVSRPRYAVTLAPVQVEAGGVDAGVVGAVLARRGPQLRYCYLRALETAPEPFGGDVVVGLLVASAGGVRETQLRSSTLADTTVADCVEAVLEHASIPATGDGKDALVVVSVELRPK